MEGRVFETRWQAYDSGVAIARNRIDQLRKDIAATQAQQTADGERLAIYQQEAANVSFLLERGYERRPRLFELQRAIADLKGRQGEQLNAIGRAREQIAGAELEIINLRNTRLAEVARDLAAAGPRRPTWTSACAPRAIFSIGGRSSRRRTASSSISGW